MSLGFKRLSWGPYAQNEGMWGSGDTVAHILKLGARCRWMFRFTPCSLYPWRQHSMHVLRRGLAVTQSGSGRFGEDRFVACVGNRTTVHRLSDLKPGCYTDWIITAHVRVSKWKQKFNENEKNNPPLSNPSFRSLVDYVERRYDCIQIGPVVVVSKQKVTK